MKIPPSILVVIFLLLAVPLQSGAAEEKSLEYEDQEVYMRVIVRTPEQLSAFYQGREFKREAIDRILQTCFLTPIVKNKTYDALWLELDEWRFYQGSQEIRRIKRDYWQKQWQEVNLPQAHQSTFAWTLMPEVRDLRLDEGVGGSVVIPKQKQGITLEARFATGMDKSGPPKVIRFEGVSCEPK